MNISQCDPPQVSSGLSARLDLVPLMKGGEFLDLIHEVIQPLPVLALKGIQFGQTGLCCTPTLYGILGAVAAL